ncbi:hypothetical protein BJX99DRAFT_261254 [Aspergillus californicus]
MPSKLKNNKKRQAKAAVSIDRHRNSKVHEVPEDTIKQIKVHHIEDSGKSDLSSPQLPVTDTSPISEKHTSIDIHSLSSSPFRRHLQALTEGSKKSPNKKGLDSKSSSVKGSSVPNSPSSIPSERKIPSFKGKKKRDWVVSPKTIPIPSSILKYIRPGNSGGVFDIDLLEADAMENGLDSGIAKGANITRTPEIGNSTIDELIAYVRGVSGTEIKARPTGDKSVMGRQGDIRAWHHRNIYCITCRGSCPVCSSSCCVREETRHKLEAEGTSAEQIEQAKNFARIIDFLGPYIKDADTFSLCSTPGGCGRHVCPDCCGVCPSEICQDIQCTVSIIHTHCSPSSQIEVANALRDIQDCKQDPWGACDWHD